MVEVTRQNFEALLPEIADKIMNCTFLAVDAEYTGIHSVDSKGTKSLFDSAEQRYDKARKNAAKFSSCQYGLAIFTRERDSNVYTMDAYNFYLFPVSFDAFGKRDVLTCQVSCIDFLARHNFDFNKFMRDGIPYLNKESADDLRNFLRANRHFMNTAEYLDRHYFPFKIQELNDNDINDVINRLAGFSRVIDIIHESQRPVVGHNFYMDLMMTYQQFYDNLPKTYSAYKSSVLENVFPVVYDTKYMAREVQKLRREYTVDDSLLVDTNLFALYTNTYSEFQLHMPLIEAQGGALVYQKVMEVGRAKNLESIPTAECHSAGFDAAVTGCVFLNLCFMAARPRPGPTHLRGLPPTFTELASRTELWRNRINIARALIPHVNLDGEDPKSHRPNWIIVKSLDGRLIEPKLLKLELVKYGDMEVEAINEKEVIVACGNMGCYRRVCAHLKRRGLSVTEKTCSQNNFINWFLGLSVGIKVILGVGLSGAIAVLLAWLKQKPFF